MICGVFDKREDGSPQPALIRAMLGREVPASGVYVVTDGPVGLGGATPDTHRKDEGRTTPPRPTPRVALVVWQGEIHNRLELLRQVDPQLALHLDISDCQAFLSLYQAYGRCCVEKINGHFAFALYDRERHEVVLGRDRLGIEALYYHDGPHVLVFGSKIAPILAHPEVRGELDMGALGRYLMFGHNPGLGTLFRGIRKVRPGSLVVVSAQASREQRYWSLSFCQKQRKSEAEYCHDIRDLVEDAIRLRMRNSDPLGVFLSGGMDSSSIAGLTRNLSDRPMWTFSYRCFGRSFDESGYARIMAEACGSEHHEIVYDPMDIRRMEYIVELMDEPFCNVGINIATFLLGQVAQGKVSRVFTGDGGDELFGGHPVYVADRVAAVFDKIPSLLRMPVVALSRRLPDSDQKLNLMVKLKRFSESLQYPRELGTHRWRIYYGDDGLKEVLHPDVLAQVGEPESLFADVFELNHEARGLDMLSRSLYVDYQTEVDFYLRRMDLVRCFQITPCFPLLDHRLVEYAASIPSHLKIRGLSDTKYIQHRAMEGVLPDAIVHRKDKLGHSVPFKNWLRDEPCVKQFVREALFGSRLGERGIVNDQHMRKLWDSHQIRRQNNSHRLWSLAVLELWLSARGL